MRVRYCTQCEMYHDQSTPHLSDKQYAEAQDYDVYHANDTIYFSEEYAEEHKES